MTLILIQLIFLTFFLGLFNNNPSYSFGGFFLALSILLMGVGLILKKKIFLDRKIFLFFTLMFSYPLFFSIYYEFFYNGVNLKYFYLMFQIFIIFWFFLCGMQFYKYKKYISNFIGLMIIVLVSLSVIFGNSSIVGKENIYASILLIMVSFFLSESKNKIYLIFVVAFSFFGILFSDARSSIIAWFLLLLIYIFYKFFERIKTLVFFGILFVSLSWIYLIVYLYKTGLGDIYNAAIYEFSGKQLYSGREKMWGDFILAINQSPLLGYGLGVDYGVIADIEYSTHNLYLAILLQQGFLGLLIFIILMYFVYLQSSKISLNQRSFAALVIPPILIQQNFELSLTQNNLSIMLLFWFLLGLDYYSSKRKIIL